MKLFSLDLRDRKTLIIGALVLALLLVFGALITAGMALGRLDRTIASRTAALREMEPLRSEARLLQQQIRQQEEKLARGEAGSAITVVEGLTTRLAGKGNLTYLRPLASVAKDGLQLETLELKVEKLSLEQLLRLLWEIENSAAAPMRVANFSVQRRFENHALLDVILQVNAYRK